MSNKLNISSIAKILAGLAVTAVGYLVFLNPHAVSVGGLTGACVLLNKFFGFPYTTTLLVLNGALFIWGIRVKGLRYVLRSLTAMILLGLLLDLPLPEIAAWAPSSKILSMVCGSLLTGIGYGLIVSADTSTGGSDLLAMIVVKRIPGVTVGMVMNGVDLIVVLASGVFEGVQSIPFSLAAMLLCNTLIDITAYVFGQAELPKWIERLKPAGQALFDLSIKKRKFNPYVAALLTCMVILFIRSLSLNEIALVIPFV